MSTSSSEDEVTVIEVLDHEEQSIYQTNKKHDKKNYNKHKFGNHTDNVGPNEKEYNMKNAQDEGYNTIKRLRKQYSINHEEDLNPDVLSPFSGTNLGNSELKDEGDSLSLQDELLVDISGIRPAGHNKSLFSIDEDSQEDSQSKSGTISKTQSKSNSIKKNNSESQGSPSKGGFQQVDLTDSETLSMPMSPQDTDPGGGAGGGGGGVFKFNQGIAGVTFDPTSPSATLSPLSRQRRDSTNSNMSDASSLFPIYEVPGVSFNMPQSDLESSSEWEDGSSGAVDRLSKDTVYQAYLKMRQRYHKYKGRYSDLARAYKEKEKESEKLRDVLTKTQDKALRKVQLLQDGLGAEVLNAARHSETENQVQTNTEGTQTILEEHKVEENGRIPSCDEGDNVSVASQCSTMTNMEQDEIIEKLKVTMEDMDENIISDVVKHKALLARCMENIRTNKEKITTLTSERDLATTQLQDKIKQIDLLKNLGKKRTISIKDENEKELEGLRFNVESSALSMAETKKQLFEELQNKEASAECFKKQAEVTESSAAEQEEKWASERSKWEEEEHRWKEERSKWEQDLQTKQTAIEDKERIIEEQTRELRIFKESSSKETSSMDQIKEEIHQLEARSKELKEGRTKLQSQIQESDTLKSQLEKKVATLEEEKVEHEKKFTSLETKTKEDLETIATLNKQNEYLKEKQSNISSANKDLESNKNELLKKLKTFETSQKGAQKKLNGLESSSAQMAKEMAQLQESNQQMDNKVKQLERKKKELESQLGEEESTKEELENQLKDIESIKNDNKSKIEKSDKEISSMSQEVQALKEENKKLKESIQKAEGEKQDLEKSLHSIKDQSTKESEEKTRIQKELISFKTEKESLQGNLDQNKSDVEKLNENIKDHALEIDNLKTSKNSLLKELEAKNTEISTIKESIEKLRIEKDKVLKKSEEYRIENEKVNQQIKSLHSECDNLKADKNRLNSEIKEKDKKVTALETSLKKKNDDHKKEINKLNENLKSTGEERNQYKNRIRILEETVKSKSEEMKRLQDNTALDSNKLASQVSELEEIIRTKDVELKEALEDKQKLDLLEKVVIQEKSKMEKEFEALKSEIKRLQAESESKSKDVESKKQEISSLNIVQDTLNQNNKKLSEDHKNKIDKLKVDYKQKFEKINTDHKLSTEKLNKEIKSKGEENVKVSKKLAELEEENKSKGEENVKVSKKLAELEEETKSKGEEDVKVSKKLAELEEENKSKGEENEKVSKKLAELEQEINNNSSLTKDKDTQLADLQKQVVEKEKLFTDQQNKNKEKYKAFTEMKNKMQEKEKSSKAVQTKLNEKEKELSDTKDQLHSVNENLTSLQVSIKQKEEKVENILKEKKAVLEEYTIKVGELEGELSKKEEQLKVALKERETQVESLENQLKEKETSSVEKIESCLQLQHSLEQKLKETEHKFLEKDQMLVRQKEETKQTEDQWQQRLRFEGIADSLSAKSRHVALFNMLKFSCEVEKVQKQHEDQLGLVRSELSKSQQCELEAVRDSHTRALQERDASCAALKDQVDHQTSSNQDAQATITDLQTQLADTQHKLKCQSERVEEVEAALEQNNTKMAEVESQVVLATTQQAVPQFACDDSQQMETLVKQNEELSEKLRNYENEKQTDAKNIAMLEFNNEHNKQKVINMEISHKALVEKYAGTEAERVELEKQLREGSKEIIDKITAQAEETTLKLEAEKGEVIQKLTKENEELQERLSKESEELHAQYENKQKNLTDQVDGLTEIKQSFEKQIKQIEKNNEEMHANIGVVQLARNEARTEAAQLKKEGELLKEELTKLGEAKASLEQDLQGLKDSNIDLQEKLSVSSGEVSNLGESIRTLENNLTNLQKQLEAVKETNAQLTETYNAEKKAKAIMEEKNVEEKKQYSEKLSALENKLSTTKEELSTDNIDTHVIGNSDDLTETKNLLRKTQEKLRLAEMLNSEVDEYRERIRSLEGKMATMEDNHNKQLHNISQESERQIAKKCEEYQQTLTSAYDQQDSETHSLIKTHKTTLQDAQQQVKEKTNVMENAQKDHESKLKYEDQIASLQSQHETHIKQVEATWRARTEKMVKQKEGQLQEEMDGLAEEWNKERKELERLTQVAACAFRSGSDSVELLKKQVSAQRKELDQVKTTHKSEMDELRQLLELKQRSRRGVGGGVKMGCQLEEAAEFEYLKNILYQYMCGNETQTLSKVLCAVVKFSNEQQAEILERADQRQNLLTAENNNVPQSNGIHSNGTIPHVHFVTDNDSKIL